MNHPRPFLKWAGGKSRLLSQFAPLFPTGFARYIEPFVGSGAVFFNLWQQDRLHSVALWDHNAELINCYTVVRDATDDLIERLAAHAARHDKDYYYAVRALRLETLGPAARAARTIYLNKTCFNGLFRVNRKGEFNVPMGRYANPHILDRDNLLAAARALRDVDIDARDFRTLPAVARAGDFVYFDPPYHPVSATAHFTSYTAGDFRESDQRDLAAVYRQLDGVGCRLMLSNSDTPLIRELYADFRIETVFVSRAINSRADRRGKVPELVVLNY